MQETRPSRVLAFACLVTLLHYLGVYMRVPILPLYATAVGASVADVGVIVGAHMTVAALSAIPLGRASDRWGRRALLLGGYVAQRWGHRTAFVVAGTIITAGILVGTAGLPRVAVREASRARPATITDLRPNRLIWAG